MSRTGWIISILVTILVTAAWWFLLVGPQRERAAQAEDELAAAMDDELLLRTQLASLRRIRDNELPFRAAIAELQAAIPDSPQTASLIDDLSVLADETGVDWLSSTYGNPSLNEDTGIFEIPISISIEGQFFEVLGYLYGSAELDRIVRIDGVAIAPRQDDNGFTILAVNITARAFTNGDVLVPIADLEQDAPPEDAPSEDAPPEDGGETTTTTAPEGEARAGSLV